MQPGRFVVLRRDLTGAAWNIRSVIHEPQTKRRRDMKILRHDQDYLEARLTPQDARWRVRAIGTGIMLALTITCGICRLLRPNIADELLYGAGMILLPLTGLALSSSFTYETQPLQLDKIKNQFHVIQRNIWGERILQGSLRQVQDVRVTRSASDDGDQYVVALQISGQPLIQLTQTNQRISAEQLFEFAPLREFLGLPGVPRPL
jgi:hypothetical protein